MPFEDSQETDVVEESGSPTTESGSSAGTQEGVAQPDASAAQDKTPFHEHPRFKELIEDRNTYKQQFSTLDQSYKQLQAQLAQMQKASEQANQPKPPSYDAVQQRLKGIDPEFAAYIEETAKRAAQVEALQKQVSELSGWRGQTQEQANRQQARSTLKELFTTNNIPEEMREFYTDRIRTLADNMGATHAAQLPGIFKQAHENINKFFETRDRSKLEGYVKAKKADATPSTTTGGAPVGQSVQQMSKEDAIKQVAKELRASRATT